MRFDRCHKPQPTSKPKSTPATKRAIDYSYSLQNESDRSIPPPPGSFRGISQEWLAENMAIQAKLTIGQPDDRYEQEADRMAKQVVRQMYKPNFELSQAQTAAEPTFPYPNLKPKSLIRRKSAIDPSGAIPTSPALETAIHQAKSGGHPLPKHLRQPMERSFGADFSQVRVHTDHRADRLSRSISAEAFTTGRDIFFRQGTYRPEISGGKELIAHELTHVVQQNRMEQTALPCLTRDTPLVQCRRNSEKLKKNLKYLSARRSENFYIFMDQPTRHISIPAEDVHYQEYWDSAHVTYTQDPKYEDLNLEQGKNQPHIYFDAQGNRRPSEENTKQNQNYKNVAGEKKLLSNNRNEWISINKMRDNKKKQERFEAEGESEFNRLAKAATGYLKKWLSDLDIFDIKSE